MLLDMLAENVTGYVSNISNLSVCVCGSPLDQNKNVETLTYRRALAYYFVVFCLLTLNNCM